MTVAELLLKGFEVAFIQLGEETVLMRKRIRVILSKKDGKGEHKSVAIVSEAEVITQDTDGLYLKRLHEFWEVTHA